MTSLGLGLESGAFKDLGRYGYVCGFMLTHKRTDSPYTRPHLLAPTASDLNKYGKMDTILAGFHTDLNFL